MAGGSWWPVVEKRKEQITAAWERRNHRPLPCWIAGSHRLHARDRPARLRAGRYVRLSEKPARLIDDKKVRIEDVRKFLGKDFPKDSLPSVEEALALAAAHRAAQELFRKDEERTAREIIEKQRRVELQRKQQPRRLAVEQKATLLLPRAARDPA